RAMTSPGTEALWELRGRVLLGFAKAHLAHQEYDEVLSSLSKAIVDLEAINPERARRLQGECFLLSAQALSAQGLDLQAIEQLDIAVDLLMTGTTAELGLQSLILRGRLHQKQDNLAFAARD